MRFLCLHGNDTNSQVSHGEGMHDLPAYFKHNLATRDIDRLVKLILTVTHPGPRVLAWYGLLYQSQACSDHDRLMMDS